MARRKFREMDKRITLQASIQVPDDMGGHTNTWTDQKERWAKITPPDKAKARNQFLAGQDIPAGTWFVDIRYDEDFTARGKRIKWKNRFLEIKSVVGESGSAYLLLICQEIFPDDDGDGVM